MRIPALLLVLLVTLAAAPSVEAALVPSHKIHGTIQVQSTGESSNKSSNKTQEPPHVAVMTGAFTARGLGRGIFTAAGTVGARVDEIDELIALDTGGRVPSSTTGIPPGGTGVAPRRFTNVSLTISDNSTLVYYTGDELQNYTTKSDFALVLAARPPGNLVAGVNLTTDPSLAVIGPADLRAQMEAPRGEAFMVFTTKKLNVSVWQAGERLDSFTTSTWVYSIRGHQRLSLDADVVLVPFAGKASASLKPGETALARERLDLNRVTEAYQQALPNATGGAPTLDKEVTQQVKQASDIFNGVLLGNPIGNATLGGKEHDLGAFTLYRFDHLDLAPGGSNEIAYSGSGAFLLVGDQLYTTKASGGSKTFPLPLLSIFLWVVAAAAIVLGYVLKPFVAAGPANAARPVRLTALIFHLVMIPIAFILWDAETKAFLGTSLLTLMGGGSGSQGVAFSAVAAVQSISFLLAWVYFGLPIRYLVNNGLKLLQLKRARGIGKGLSYLSAWGIGAPFYALLLNPFIGLFIDSLGGIK